jgi:repressor of nif and glnA expression
MFDRIDYDEIRKEVAIAHNVIIPKDDPVLATVTMNELVFQRYIEIVNEQNEALLKKLEEAQQKGIADAKLTAGRVITEAAAFVSDQVNTAVLAAMEEGREQIRHDLRKAREETEESRKASAKWAAVSSLCAVITVGSVLVNVF